MMRKMSVRIVHLMSCACRRTGEPDAVGQIRDAVASRLMLDRLELSINGAILSYRRHLWPARWYIALHQFIVKLNLEEISVASGRRPTRSNAPASGLFSNC